MDWLWIGGEGPGEVPWWAGWELTNEFKLPQERLAQLRSVQKAGFRRGKPVTLIRIYDPYGNEEDVLIQDFNSLDEHPELILYEGYREEELVFLERGAAPEPKPRRAE